MRTSNRTGLTVALPVSLLLAASLTLLGACSSLPSKNQPVNERKNEAAGYIQLADDFLAKNQYASALQFYDQALRTNLAVDYVEGAITARSSLGRVYLRLQAWDEALRELNDALHDARILDDDALLALCLNNLGEYYYISGDDSQAVSYFQSAAILADSGKDEKLLAVINHNLGVAAVRAKDLEAARSFFEAARSANEKAKRWSEYAANCYMLASIENQNGNTALALEWAGKALEADKNAENSIGIAADLEALARLQRK
ncbi:MAG: tetratricopeptide repeat protein, partial [Spirochaetes bacterium]|nr:tetratricopeptide repeat protein [Spirochaetota bacterium]MBU0956027.1 tetratricopeptide repeat protein [Spirochaetota bacterium]